tara:strand:- start:11094 stop:12416 length:1323 start_codon:yes stop_codon:yes gene_type:complete
LKDFLIKENLNFYNINPFNGFFILLLILPIFFLKITAFTNITIIFFTYVFFILTPTYFLFRTLNSDHSLVDVSFWVYIYIFFGFSGLMQFSSEEIPWINFYNENQIYKSIVIVVCGIFGYIFGRYGEKKFTLPSRDFLISRIHILFFTSVFLAFLLFAILGFEKIIYPRFLFDLTVRESGYLQMLIIRFLKVSPFICLISYIIKHEQKAFSSWNLIIVCLLMFVYFNPIRSERLSLLMLLAFIFLYLVNYNKKFWMSSLSIGLAFIFPYLDYFRESLSDTGFSKQNSYDVISHFISGDFDAFSTIILSINYIKFNDFLFFNNFFDALFVYIPRSIWTDKPISSSFLLTNDGGIQFSSIATNYWAEGYLALGFIGVFLSLLATGILVKSISEQKNSSNFIQVIYIFFTPYMIYFLRGDLYSIAFRLIPLIILTYLVTESKD